MTRQDTDMDCSLGDAKTIDWGFVEFVVGGGFGNSDKQAMDALGGNAGSVIDLCRALIAERAAGSVESWTVLPRRREKCQTWRNGHMNAWWCDRCRAVSNAGDVDDPPEGWRFTPLPVRGSQGARSIRDAVICADCDDSLYHWYHGSAWGGP